MNKHYRIEYFDDMYNEYVIHSWKHNIDKKDIIEFAKSLNKNKIRIISEGKIIYDNKFYSSLQYK